MTFKWFHIFTRLEVLNLAMVCGDWIDPSSFDVLFVMLVWR